MLILTICVTGIMFIVKLVIKGTKLAEKGISKIINGCTYASMAVTAVTLFAI